MKKEAYDEIYQAIFYYPCHLPSGRNFQLSSAVTDTGEHLRNDSAFCGTYDRSGQTGIGKGDWKLSY
jgi:hypothetical protein